MHCEYNHTVTACFIFNLRKKHFFLWLSVQLFIDQEKEKGLSCCTFYCVWAVVTLCCRKVCL